MTSSFQLDDTGFDALITEGDSRKARFIPDRRIGGTDHFPLRYIRATLLCGSQDGTVLFATLPLRSTTESALRLPACEALYR
jgi:hypothetical protein